MRQRKVKNLDEKLSEMREFLVEKPEDKRGCWNAVFGNDKPICLEIGCGKGKFLASQAASNRERNYIGIEGQASVLLRALEKAGAAQHPTIPNIRFVSGFVRDLADWFGVGELDTIYLNFSDPWPKDRHAKRRLTHRTKLCSYFEVLKPAGTIEIKTDNDGLFEFTMREIESQGYEILEHTTDLHNSTFVAKTITTEYEDKFKALGKNINYVKIKR